MAPNGKAFSSQIKKMSKKPLKYNPEEVMVVKVDMPQDMFNFAMDTARECMGKFKKEDEPSMAKHAVDKFSEEHGKQRFYDLQSCIDKRKLTSWRLVRLFILFEYF